jgi:hypothetical protein
MKKEYLKFLRKTIIFLIVLILMDFILGSIARFAFFSQRSGKYSRITYSLEKTQDSILIFGSSHALNHYIPAIIEDSLKISCYNAGIQGQGILMFSTIQKIILQRHTPYVTILNIDPEFLQEYKQRYDLLSDIEPYYFLHKEIIGNVLKYKSNFEKTKLLSKLYQYNSTIVHIIKYWLYPQSSYEGFHPLAGIIPASRIEMHNKTIEKELKIDTVFVNKLKNFINTSLAAKTKLVFIVSPVIYKSSLDENKSFSLIKKISKFYNIPMLNYHNDSSFIGKNILFKDLSHLNNKGAEVFTKKVAHDLKSLLFTKNQSFENAH